MLARMCTLVRAQALVMKRMLLFPRRYARPGSGWDGQVRNANSVLAAVSSLQMGDSSLFGSGVRVLYHTCCESDRRR